MIARIKSRFPREKTRGNPTPCRHEPVTLYTGRTLKGSPAAPFGPKPAPGAGLQRVSSSVSRRVSNQAKPAPAVGLARPSARVSIFQPGATPCAH